MEKANFPVSNATKKPKLPEIRQTLTSKYRLLKANPILLHEMEQKLSNAHELTNTLTNLNKSLKTIAVALDDKPKSIIPPRRITSKPKLPPFRPSSAPAKAKPEPLKLTSKPKPVTIARVDSGKKIDFISRNKQAIANKTEFKRPRPLAPKADVPKKPVPERKPIRRSLSAQHFDRVKCKSEKSNSAEALNNHSGATKLKVGISPIVEEQSPELSFRTPMAYERRSIAKFKTPNTTINRRSTVTNNSVDLQQRLNDWLKKRGKSLGEFHHLKCFGVRAKECKVAEENKENVEREGNEEDRGSYEDLSIVKPPEKEIDLNFIANEALVDLYKLILEGFPREQCEAWLSLMREKYKDIEKEPQYWECRAAIEQARGNITSAVEFYKTAIVQGADVKAVDESLDQLLRKFSLLNINAEKNASAKDRNRIVADARNVFKSSIIQFAVQERTLKKTKTGGEVDGEKKMFIATPVRRSTRLTRSTYSTTPGMKIFCSLQEVDEPMKNHIDFHPNHAL